MTLMRTALGFVALLAVIAVVAACGGRHAATHKSSLLTSLPVIGCKTLNAVGAGRARVPAYLPVSAPLPAGLAQSQAAVLAWYEGDVKTQPGLKVLAPRGWHCSAGIGADGGWTFTANGVKAKQSIELDGLYNGPGASAACNYFPSAASSSPLPSDCKAPQGTSISFATSHLANLDAALTSGLHSLGFAYWYPELQNTFESASCTLPASRASTCAAILAEAKARVGKQLAAYVKKYGSSATPVTTTTASSSQQLTATITGKNSSCLRGASSSGLSSAPTSADTFDLRRPGNGLTEGDVLAVPTNKQSGSGGCSIVLTFNIGTDLGFYVVYDESAGVSWGPFDASQLPAEGWAISLTVS